MQVHAEISSPLDGKSAEEVKNTLDQLYHSNVTQESVAELLVSEEPEKREIGRQVFMSVVNEIVNSGIKDTEFEQFVESLKYEATQNLLDVNEKRQRIKLNVILQAPVKTFNEILALSQSLKQLHDYNEPEDVQPLLKQFTTNYCKVMTEKSLEMLKNEKDPLNVQDKSQEISELNI